MLTASLVPIAAGAYGVLGGMAETAASDPSSASHVRYLSGLLLAIGVAFVWCARRIEARTSEVRLLTSLVAAGGLARLLGTAETGLSTITAFALFMELVVTPLLCLWQSRVAGAAS